MKIAVLGASGRTGRLLVELALERGEHVRALVRSPAKLGVSHPALELVQGDATDPDAVRRVVRDCDAVVSALGPSPGSSDVCSTATRHVIDANPPRYVAISGAGIDVPGDDKDFVGKVVSFLVRTLSPGPFRDKVREHALLEQSTLSWTLVRPPRLVDAPGTGKPRVSLVRSPGASVSRHDLAEFVLRCIEDDALVRKAPFIAR